MSAVGPSVALSSRFSRGRPVDYLDTDLPYLIVPVDLGCRLPSNREARRQGH
jgi:hypothetical protein